MLVCYFSRGPLFGVRQQIEPDIRPSVSRTVLILAILVATLAIAPFPLNLGIVWLCFSPPLLYVFSTVPETIYEHRAYLMLLGVALIGSWVSQFTPVLVLILLLLLSARTIQRNSRLRTENGFWELAHEESPNHWRPGINHACRLELAGNDHEALRLFIRFMKAPRPVDEIAMQHICALFIKLNQLDDANILLGDRGEAIMRFPNSGAIRKLRGAMLLAQGKTKQAERAFQVAEVLG